MSALETLPVTCPNCGKTWLLHNYALVGVAEHDRLVRCSDCTESKEWANRMLREREKVDSRP